MAAAPVSVEDDLSCPICCELFVDPHTPRCLPLCGHVCCEVCLQKMVAEKSQRTCPECKKEIKIPDDDIASFTTIYRLRNLAKHAKSSQKACGNLSQSQASTKKDGNGVPLCENHDDEKMHYYCVTCNSLACEACLVLTHNGDGHIIEGIKELYKKQTVEMKSASSRAKSRIADVEHALSELETAKLQSGEIHDKMKIQIDKCAESHMNKLLKETTELKRQVEQTEQVQVAALDRELLSVQKQISSVKEAYQATISASENLPYYKYITQHNQLVNNMEDIRVSKPKILAGKTKQDVLKFVPRSLRIKFGQIISVAPEKVRTIKKIQTLDGFVDAHKVDCCPDGLIATVDFTEKKIVLYCEGNDKYEKKMDVKLPPYNQFKPNDIACSPDSRFMVARVTCIEVYSPDGNHQNDIKIKGSNGVSVNRVQVTLDGRILVGDYHRSLLLELSPTGSVTRTIYASIKPSHMAHIHDTHIAISDDIAGKVIVIDIESGQETLKIDILGVNGICYDKHTECLLIARSEPSEEPGMVCPNSGVIEQYSYTTGKLIACLRQELHCPYGMTLTTTGHLIVANQKTIEIYEIQ